MKTLNPLLLTSVFRFSHRKWRVVFRWKPAYINACVSSPSPSETEVFGGTLLCFPVNRQQQQQLRDQQMFTCIRRCDFMKAFQTLLHLVDPAWPQSGRNKGETRAVHRHPRSTLPWRKDACDGWLFMSVLWIFAPCGFYLAWSASNAKKKTERERKENNHELLSCDFTRSTRFNIECMW